MWPGFRCVNAAFDPDGKLPHPRAVTGPHPLGPGKPEAGQPDATGSYVMAGPPAQYPATGRRDGHGYGRPRSLALRPPETVTMTPAPVPVRGCDSLRPAPAGLSVFQVPSRPAGPGRAAH